MEQLTRTLYDEGLAKGREEADRLLKEAGEQAEAIVKKARAEAEGIVRQARESADELRTNTLNEVAEAGRGMVSQIRGQIVELVVSRSLASVGSVTLDAGFLRELILTVARNWNGRGGGLVALLPQRAELDKNFSATVDALLKAGLEVGYSDRVRSGFRIAERDGGYYIDFSDESFEALLGEYLRDRAAEILFGGGE